MSWKTGSQWPEAKLKKLRDLDAQGLSLREMGRLLGCSQHAIGRQRRNLGLPPRPSPLNDPSPLAPEHHHRRMRVPKGASTLPQLASLVGDET